MNKFALMTALSVAARVAVAGSEPETVSLEQKIESLQRDVASLQEQARQQHTGMQNPDLSSAVDFITSYSDAADNLNFTPRDVELMVQANADPFAKAYMVFNAESELEPVETSDPFSEVSLGVEEAAIQSTALPCGLSLKGGLFFADFTRLGRVHSHDLPFVDRPASLEKIIGGEDKARGLELSWLPPVDHYVRLTLGVVDDIGAEAAVNSSLLTADGEEADAFAGDDNRSFDALTCYGRVATLLEVGDSAVLRLGADASRKEGDASREMASADFKLDWKPVASGNNLFELGGEWLTSKRDGDLAEDALFEGGPTTASADASGGYIYAQYRLTPLWQPGIRVDYTKPESFAAGDSGLETVKDNLHTYSAYLTAWLSEFNRLRLQANYVQSDNEIADGRDDDVQVFLQWSAILGTHKHDFVP